MDDVVVIVMTDGRRQYMTEAMDSLVANVKGPISRYVIHDDSGDPHYQNWLRRNLAGHVITTPGRQGFAGAYASAWQWARQQPERWVFQTEDDFVFNRPCPLDCLIGVLNGHPYIAQMQLRRQPWWVEPEDGGFVGQWPELYTDATDGEHHWLEHRRNWSTNPGLFRRETCERGWPLGIGSEKALGDAMLAADPELRFALWGRREDPPAVNHIGHNRIGTGY